MPDVLVDQADHGTAMKNITKTDLLLLTARVHNFYNRSAKSISFEHGRLPENIDIFLALGLVCTMYEYCNGNHNQSRSIQFLS